MPAPDGALMYLSSRTLTVVERTPAGEDDPALDAPLSAGAPDEPGPAGPALPPDPPADASAGDPDAPTGLEGNVVALGTTSLFTDISAEMIFSVLPLLFMDYGFTPLQFGLFDGVYKALAAIVALGAAVVADRRRRLKELAGGGYALSALATLGLVLVPGMWLAAVAFLYVDRLGKGIRTAPRDAIISLSVRPRRLGRAFGLHRAFDTVGAVVGPILASIVLARTVTGYRTVFLLGLLASIVGLACFVLFVDGRHGHLADGAPVAARRAPVAGRLRRDLGLLLRIPTFRLALLVAGGLALLMPGEGLLYLTFQREAVISNAQFPLLFVGGSVAFLLASYPVGLLADRIGRWRVVLAGEVLLLGVFAVLASGARGLPALAVMLVLIGACYAATDGVLMAIASEVLPRELRTTGLGLLIAAIAVGNLVASTTYGYLWGTVGGAAAARWFALGLVVVTAVGAVLVRRRPDRHPVGEPA